MSPLLESSIIAARLAKVPTCTAIDILLDYGVERMVMRDVRPIQHADNITAGRARTLRYLPSRPDFAASVKTAANFKLIDSAEPGDVLVFDAMRGIGGSVLGDMLALRAAVRRVRAVITDGAVRDLAGLAQTGLTVFAGHVWPVPFRGTLVPWEVDVPIQCGGILVLPGDWILADRDAVLSLPEELVRLVIDKVDGAMNEEAFSRQLLERGHELIESFPIKPHLRPLYDRYLKDGQLPTDEELSSVRINGGRPRN